MVFGQPSDVDADLDIDKLPPVAPNAVADSLRGDAPLALNAVRVLAVMALVDGIVDQPKLELVEEYAKALDVHAKLARAIDELCVNHVRWVVFDQIRANVATIPGLPWIPMTRTRRSSPYGGDAGDPALTARYEELGTLPAGTFGRVSTTTTGQRLRVPRAGARDGRAWATMHDSLHVLSGYSTSAQGELLVAVFTGAQFEPPRNVDMMEKSTCSPRS